MVGGRFFFFFYVSVPDVIVGNELSDDELL